MEEALWVSGLLLLWGLFFDKPRRIWAALMSGPAARMEDKAGLLVDPSTGEVQAVPAIAGVEEEFARLHSKRTTSSFAGLLGPHSWN
ncbi:MAG: hypothetical protein FJ404_10590 [Verrucomicrobia bacterium]|nr:hypothetical protein [Verrucomicrobiota bacterium]